MHKTGLVTALRAREPWMRQSDALQIIDALLEDTGLIADALAAGQDVSIPGFGVFEVKKVAAREGRNPKTGESIQIPAHRRVAFRAGKGLKSRVAD